MPEEDEFIKYYEYLEGETGLISALQKCFYIMMRL
uniref:RNA polymerase sigma factor n=1 Tax=Heterorhabditis bacteriophora TaxID=37862 RepID=A0A1I7WU65_HETBA